MARNENHYDLYCLGEYIGTYNAREIAKRIGVTETYVRRCALYGDQISGKWEIALSSVDAIWTDWKKTCRKVRKRMGWK